MLFDHCNQFGFEGVVSKRQLALFERAKPQLGQDEVPGMEAHQRGAAQAVRETPRKPELTEAQKTLAKKREELARVIERLRSHALSQGMARELRKHVAILEREIAELDHCSQ